MISGANVRRARIGVLTLFLALALAGSARAADHLYVVPAPQNPLSLCQNSDPCSLDHAIELAHLNPGAGSDITIAPGGYVLTNEQNLNGWSIHGTPGLPDPQIIEQLPSGSTLAPSITTSDGTVSHLGLVQTVIGGTAVDLGSGATVEDVYAECAVPCFAILETVGGSNVIRDSVFWEPTNAVGNAGLDLEGIGNVVRNVTVVVNDGRAIRVSGGPSSLDVRNSVLRGQYDLFTVGGPISVTLGWNDVRSTAIGSAAGTPTINDLGHNVPEEPVRFVNPDVGDFRLMPNSALIDAGTRNAIGQTDLAGNPRVLGAAPDIGAYEAVFSPPGAATGGATAVMSTSAKLSGTVTPNGRPTTYHFEWGASLAYGHRSAEKSVGNGTQPAAVSLVVSGLQRDTVYHYRLVARSAYGTTAGPDRVLRTKTVSFAGVIVKTRSARVRRNGTIRVRLSCPRGVFRRCSGSVRLELPLAAADAAAGRGVRFSIAPGKSRMVTLRLSGSARKLIGRRVVRAQLVALASDGLGHQRATVAGILLHR